MNVYTHVAMDDLATDVESLPAMGDSLAAPKPAPEPQPSATPEVPADLANLLGNWDSLPEHVRHAIATLAGA